MYNGLHGSVHNYFTTIKRLCFIIRGLAHLVIIEWYLNLFVSCTEMNTTGRHLGPNLEDVNLSKQSLWN